MKDILINIKNKTYLQAILNIIIFKQFGKVKLTFQQFGKMKTEE